MIEIKLYKYVCNNPGFSQFYPVNSEKAFLEKAKNYQPVNFFDGLFNPFKEFDIERTNNLIVNKVFIEPKENLDLYYFTYRYKLCDIMDPWVGLTDGIFVSQKCLDIFTKHLNLPPVKIYPIFYKKKNKIISDYYFMYFYYGLRDSIDFKKSLFMLVPKFEVGNRRAEEYAIERDINFFSQANCLALIKGLTSTRFSIDYQKVVFPKGSISKYDIFPVHLLHDSELYLSEKFIEIYQKEGLTGLDLNRTFDKFWEDYHLA